MLVGGWGHQLRGALLDNEKGTKNFPGIEILATGEEKENNFAIISYSMLV